MMPRWMPEWIGPASYFAVLVALAIVAAGVTQLPVSKATAGATKGSEGSKPAAQRPVRSAPDTPDSAPQLSPVYPTAVYPPSMTNYREEALRKIKSASADRPKKRRPNADAATQASNGFPSETTGFGGAPTILRSGTTW